MRILQRWAKERILIEEFLGYYISLVLKSAAIVFGGILGAYLSSGLLSIIIKAYK